MRKFISLSSVWLLCSSICFAQSGKLDPSFGSQGIVKADMGSPFDNNSVGRQVLIQPGGSIYIVFNYPTFISKRFPNGSIDSSYGYDGFSTPVSFNDGYAALQPDGKIVIAGSGFGVARLNTNGMPDSTFGVDGMQTVAFNSDSYASAVAIQGDGKIVVAGTSVIDANTFFALARYNADGSLDNTFKGRGQVTTDFGFKVPADDGSTDSIEIHEQSATSIGIEANGKIVVGGYAFNGVDFDFAVACYNMNGNPDDTFDNDGRQTTKIGFSDDFGYSLALQSDGKIILAGYTYGDSYNNFAVVRYKINGSPDSSFNSTGIQTVNLLSDGSVGNSVAIQSTGKIVVAGYTLNGTNNDFAIARFNTDGSPDNTFDTDGILTTDFTSSDDYAHSVTIQSDDKILVAGYSNISSPVTVEHLAVSRYNQDGGPDSSFADNGKLEGIPKQGYTKFNTSAIQADGKIVVAGSTWNGSNYDFAVARYNTNGSPDSTFSDDGKQITDFGSTDEAVSVVIQPDGKIVVAGNSDNQFAMARYNADGSLDNSFSEDGKLIISMGFADVCTSVALQRDGKIVMAGYTFTDTNYDSSYFAIARFSSDGTPDNTFSDDGKQLTEFDSSPSFAASAVIQNDGKILVAGRSYLNNQDNFSLARYNIDGSADTTFSHDGKQNNVFGPDDYFAESVVIQNDGKIIVAGYSQSAFSGGSSFAVARYSTNGELDNTFNDDGFQSTYLGSDFNLGTCVALSNNGRIAVGGTNDNYAIVLYKNDGNPDSTFGRNGIQTTHIGIGGSLIQSLAFANNKLYAAGNGQFPGTLGVIARYLLSDGEVLPVSLLDFTAVLQNKSVQLQWKIATQKNLASFVIERSADANRFLPINNVTASGISTFTRNYSVMDDQPLQGINFYRLKMVDVDGKFTYSNIVAVKINENNKLQIFPNPAKRILFVEANGNNENSIVQIIDAGGRKLKEMKVFLNGQTSFSIDISNLSNGIYNLVLQKKEKREVQTFIKR